MVKDETEEQAEGGGGSGMGVSVSVMSSPQLDEETSTGLHAYAIRDDIAAMSAFLHAGEDLDINALDEYVSKVSWGLASFMTAIPTVLQGYTALHLASDRGNVAMVELLLKSGADKTLKVSTTLTDYENVLIRNFSTQKL